MLGMAFVFVCAFGPTYIASEGDNVILKVLSRISTQTDYTVRLAAEPKYCLTTNSTQAGSPVKLRRCDSSTAERKMFDLMEDGTVRLYQRKDIYNTLCVTLGSTGDYLYLAKCLGSAPQVWTFQPSGTFELTAQKGMCMNLWQNDLEGGHLGLYPCQHNYGDVFFFGGSHFMAPELVQEIGSISKDLVYIVSWLSSKVITLWLFSLILCACYTAAVWFSEWGGKMSLKYITTATVLAVIATVAAAQCFTTLHVGLTYRDISYTALELGKVQHLDYTLRLSSYPHHCATQHDVAPYMVTMEPCMFGNSSQQWVLDSTKEYHFLRIRSRSNTTLCLSRNSHSVLPEFRVVMKPCDEDRETMQTFAHPKGTGGSLPLVNSDLCLNLGFGDIGKGILIFYQCSHDLDQVFVYDEGNPTVARLLEHVHKLWRVTHYASIGPSLWCSKVAGLYLICGLLLAGALSFVRWLLPSQDFFFRVVFAPLLSLID
jgi:hypothetical protein